MVAFPNAKINLGLRVTGKRADGFHNIETVFYPVQCRDVLEAVRANELHFTTSGLAISGSVDDNLCLKAYHLLQQRFNHLPPVHIHLHKAIPMGAGLGGGSADGAFMLVLLNKKFQLGLSNDDLKMLALELGSDCPFFIENEPCIGRGRGEILTPVTVDLAPYDIVLVNPGIHVSTGKAFAALTPRQPSLPIEDIISQPVEAWKENLHNDFERPVFDMHPEIGELKDVLYNAGAVYASMSGSGSTVYGLFKKATYSLPQFPEDYTVMVV